MTHYTEINKCIFCNSFDIKKILNKDYTIALGCYPVNENDICYTMPYNVNKCLNCKSHQLSYFGDINIIYNYSANFFGKIRNKMNEIFANFILSNEEITNIVEIGAGNGSLSEEILKNKQCKYSIIDPTYSGLIENRNIYRTFFEKIDDKELIHDTIIMSHVFEHFYNPTEIIEKISNCKTIKNVYINIPNLEKFIKSGDYHVLNTEHIFYVENAFIEKLFNKYSFVLKKQYEYEEHSIFFHFQRDDSYIYRNIIIENSTSENDVEVFFKNIFERIENIHNTINNLPKNTKIYIWPCSMHTVYLLAFGLNSNILSGVLDNSNYKIGKFLYNTKLKCYSFNDIINSKENIAVILNGGCYNKEIEINKNITLI